MSKKRFKHKKMPICYKAINTGLYEQNQKVIAEFMNQQEKFCKVDRNTRGERLTRGEVIAYGQALAVLSYAAQQNIYILEKQYGAHFCFTADGIIKKAIEAQDKEGGTP